MKDLQQNELRIPIYKKTDPNPKPEEPVRLLRAFIKEPQHGVWDGKLWRDGHGKILTDVVGWFRPLWKELNALNVQLSTTEPTRNIGTVMRMHPDGHEEMQENVPCTLVTLDDGDIIQVNHYEEGQWDVYHVSEETSDCTCIAASFNKPDRHFNE